MKTIEVISFIETVKLIEDLETKLKELKKKSGDLVPALKKLSGFKIDEPVKLHNGETVIILDIFPKVVNDEITFSFLVGKIKRNQRMPERKKGSAPYRIEGDKIKMSLLNIEL